MSIRHCSNFVCSCFSWCLSALGGLFLCHVDHISHVSDKFRPAGQPSDISQCRSSAEGHGCRTRADYALTSMIVFVFFGRLLPIWILLSKYSNWQHRVAADHLWSLACITQNGQEPSQNQSNTVQNESLKEDLCFGSYFRVVRHESKTSCSEFDILTKDMHAQRAASRV